MSPSEPAPSFSPAIESSATCPMHAHSLARQKTSPVVEPANLPIECDASGVWHIRGFEEARAILRSKDVRQSGFNAKKVLSINILHNKPILYLEGKSHQ